MSFPASADHRFFAPWRGVVIDNRDPRGLHRVRARVPGLVNDTGWATPRTAGGGAPQQGGHVAPPVGADVVMEWCGGNPDDPIYSGGHWGVRDEGGSELPTQAQVSEAELVSFLQLGRLLIRADLRARDNEAGIGQMFIVQDTQSETSIRFDLAKNGISINTDYLLELKSTGIVKIEGAQVQINGRLVKASPRGI